MTILQRTVVICDGTYACKTESTERIPTGWMVFTDEGGDQHLCPECSQNDSIVDRLRYWQQMTKIDRKRGD